MILTFFMLYFSSYKQMQNIYIKNTQSRRKSTLMYGWPHFSSFKNLCVLFASMTKRGNFMLSKVIKLQKESPIKLISRFYSIHYILEHSGSFLWSLAFLESERKPKDLWKSYFLPFVRPLVRQFVSNFCQNSCILKRAFWPY